LLRMLWNDIFLPLLANVCFCTRCGERSSFVALGSRAGRESVCVSRGGAGAAELGAMRNGAG